MNKPIGRIAAIVISVSFAFAPALVSAQSVTGSTTIGSLQSQIQALLTQLQSLQAQLISLVHASSSMPWMNGTSTPPQWNTGSSTPPMQGGGNCPLFDRDLSQGASGSDVSQLQQFLANLPGNLFPSADVTGFFGPMTQKAVGSFQMQFGISSSSVGDVGPITRMFFQNRCGGMMGTSTPPTRPMPPPIAPWMGSSTPPHMGTSTEMWMNGTTTGHMPPRPTPQESASGWMGSIPPWQNDQ